MLLVLIRKFHIGIIRKYKLLYFHSLPSPLDEFEMNPLTGDLITRRNVRLSDGNRYITVEARDNGQPAMSSRTVIELRMGENNENSPFTVLFRNSTLHVEVTMSTTHDYELTITGT